MRFFFLFLLDRNKNANINKKKTQNTKKKRFVLKQNEQRVAPRVAVNLLQSRKKKSQSISGYLYSTM